MKGKKVERYVNDILATMPDPEEETADLKALRETCLVLLNLAYGIYTEREAERKLLPIRRDACARDAQRAGESL